MVFKLFHTFEKMWFGIDHIDPGAYEIPTDRICGMLPDPGGLFEVYVTCATCHMLGYNIKMDKIIHR